MPENAVKVDRTTKWGNPFIIGRDGTREECIARYRQLMTAGSLNGFTKEQLAYRDRVLNEAQELRGKDLACWCTSDAPCHADVLLELAKVR